MRKERKFPLMAIDRRTILNKQKSLQHCCRNMMLHNAKNRKIDISRIHQSNSNRVITVNQSIIKQLYIASFKSIEIRSLPFPKPQVSISSKNFCRSWFSVLLSLERDKSSSPSFFKSMISSIIKFILYSGWHSAASVYKYYH